MKNGEGDPVNCRSGVEPWSGERELNKPARTPEALGPQLKGNNMKSRNAVIAIGAMALTLVLTANLAQAGAGAAGNPRILPPGASPYGSTYGEWSVKWWQWVFSLPATNSPIADTGDCSAGQSGPVWFLAGAFVSTPLTRTCTVPAGKALFFPIMNAWADNTWCPDWTTYTVDELVGFVQWYMENAGALACTIDGRPVTGLGNAATSPYRVGPQVFSYTLAPEDNIFANGLGPLWGVDLSCIADGTTVAPAAEDGVYLMVAPLSAGQHTIRFTVEGFLDITYDLTVLK